MTATIVYLCDHRAPRRVPPARQLALVTADDAIDWLTFRQWRAFNESHREALAAVADEQWIDDARSFTI